MKHRRSIEFKRLFAALPAELQAQAKERFKLLQENPAHPTLHFKEFKSTSGGMHLDGMFSVRVTGAIRALGTEVSAKPHVIVWFFIGNHVEYTKLFTKGAGYSKK